MDGLLYYQVHAVDEPRVVVPANEDLKYKLVYEVHDTPIAGHLGREKTYAALASHFWWPKMYSWVEKYLRTCDVCQRVKPSANSRAPLASLPVPADCWKSVSLDFVFGLPPDADGHNGVLVFVDRLSKMVHLAPAIDTVTAEQSAKLFIDCVFRHHGLPDTIVSDRDTRFTADFWSHLFRLLGTRLEMATKDHPETDGQTERANRVVEDILRSFCAASPSSWSDMLPMVEFAINNAVHASTGFTPFYLNGLRHPALPLCLMGDKFDSGVGGARQSLASQLSSIDKRLIRQSVDTFLTERVSVVTRVRDAMAEAQDLQKTNADRHGRGNDFVFNEGDYLLVSTKNIADAAVSSLGSSKLLPRFIGPFKVLKRAGNAYTLDLPSWIRIHPTFYVGLLKPYLTSTDCTDDAPASGNANESALEEETESASGRAEGILAPPAAGIDRSLDAAAGAPPLGVTPLSPSGLLPDGLRTRPSQPAQDGGPSENPPSSPGDTNSGSQSLSTRLRASSPAPTGAPESRVGETAPAGLRRSRRSALQRLLAPGTAVGTTLGIGFPSSLARAQRIVRPERMPLPVVDRDGVPHYHIENVVGARRHNGELQLLVKWLGYPSSQNSWEPHAQLLADCRDVVRAWEVANPQWLH